MDKMDLKNFFRFFAPAIITMLYGIFLVFCQSTVEAKRIIQKILNLGIDDAVVLILAVSVIGHLQSTVYHAVINILKWRVEHVNFVQNLKRKNVLSYPDSTIVDELTSVAITDALYYYLMPEFDTEKDKVPNKRRVESFFDFLHGLGALICGWVLVTIIWIIYLIFHNRYYECVDPEKFFYFLLSLGILLCLFLGWRYLRSICKANAEFVIGGLLSLREEPRTIDLSGGEIQQA